MKKTLIYTLSMGLSLSLVLNAGITYAADEQQSHESKATITFEAPIGKNVKPVNPINPGEENKEVDEDEVTGYKGPLSLDYVSNLDFGENIEIRPDKQEYITETNNPYIQVSDLRGTGAGWHLTAEADYFEQNISENVTENTLLGSKISFINGHANSLTAEEKSPVVMSPIELETGDSSKLVANASAKDVEFETAKGVGTWIIGWFNTDSTEKPDGKVILEVPAASAAEGEHTSTINWTSYNGPHSASEDGNNETPIDGE